MFKVVEAYPFAIMFDDEELAVIHIAVKFSFESLDNFAVCLNDTYHSQIHLHRKAGKPAKSLHAKKLPGYSPSKPFPVIC